MAISGRKLNQIRCQVFRLKQHWILGEYYQVLPSSEQSRKVLQKYMWFSSSSLFLWARFAIVCLLCECVSIITRLNANCFGVHPYHKLQNFLYFRCLHIKNRKRIVKRMLISSILIILNATFRSTMVSWAPQVDLFFIAWFKSYRVVIKNNWSLKYGAISW